MSERTLFGLFVLLLVLVGTVFLSDRTSSPATAEQSAKLAKTLVQNSNNSAGQTLHGQLTRWLESALTARGAEPADVRIATSDFGRMVDKSFITAYRETITEEVARYFDARQTEALLACFTRNYACTATMNDREIADGFAKITRVPSVRSQQVARLLTMQVRSELAKSVMEQPERYRDAEKLYQAMLSAL